MTDMRERDLVEGRYTQAQPEAAEPRILHGRYTGTEGRIHPETDVVGAYVGTQHDGLPPLVRSARLRGGDYPRADHGREAVHR